MKKIFTLALGLLLISANLYAAGDLVVNGKLGVGQTVPVAKLHVESANETGLKTLTKTSHEKNWPKGFLPRY